MAQIWNEENFTWVVLGISHLGRVLFFSLINLATLEGAFSIFALATARSQLATFKKRCEVRTEVKKDNINQETEDGTYVEAFLPLSLTLFPNPRACEQTD